MTEVRDYKKTNARLLKSALKLFLKDNFIETSIRQICKNAGVTTGAFYKHFKNKQELMDAIVNPYLSAIKTLYYQSFAGEGFIIATKMMDNEINNYWINDANELDIFIDYLYDNHDITNLLLFKSEGSKYENIIEKLTLFMQTKTSGTIKELIHADLVSVDKQIDPNDIHFFIYSFYATVYDILKHNYPIETTKQLINNLYQFFAAAWRDYLN